MHRRILAFLLTFAPLACSDDSAPSPSGDADTDLTTTTTPASGGSTADEPCPPGYETCPCVEGGLCLEGLQCLSEICVEMPVEASTSDGPIDETTSTTAPIAEESSSSTGTPEEESSTSRGEGESSSSTGVEATCFTGDTFCAAPGTTMLTCVDEQWTEAECTENCLLNGHTGTDCDANQQECVCPGFSDSDCELDMEVLCYCYFEDYINDPCTAEQREQFYQWCYQDTDPVVACFGSYYDGTTLDCDSAISNCA